MACLQGSAWLFLVKVADVVASRGRRLVECLCWILARDRRVRGERGSGMEMADGENVWDWALLLADAVRGHSALNKQSCRLPQQW